MKPNPFLTRDPRSWEDLLHPEVSLDDLGDAILPYLDLDSDSELLGLLGLEPSCRSRLVELFKESTSVLSKEEADNLVVLCEDVLEARGRLSAAVAFYALGHDDLFPLESLRAKAHSCIFRLKIGHALLMLDEYDSKNISRCADFALRTTHLLNTLSPGKGLHKEALYALRFEQQSWLGGRLNELGRYPEAVVAFCEATVNAENLDNRISSVAQTASAMEKAGTPQEALEMMLLWQEDLDRVEDPEILELWNATKGALLLNLGGSLKKTSSVSRTEPFSQLSALMEQHLSGIVDPSHEELRVLREFSKGAFEETPEPETELRHRLLLNQARLSASAQDWAAVHQCLEDAADLEARFSTEAPKLERLILEARVCFQRQDLERAADLFSQAHDRASTALDPLSRMDLAGHFIASLGALNRPEDLEEIASLTAEVVQLLRQCLWAQPMAPARRRVRELAQRPLSSVILALWFVCCREGADSQLGQEALARAWQVSLQARNPELQGSLPQIVEKDLRAALGQWENYFYRTLRASEVLSQGVDWQEALEKLLEQELAIARDPRPEPAAETSLPSQGPALAFFQIGDLLKSRPILVLFRDRDRYAGRLLEDSNGSEIDRLKRWGPAFALGQLRDLPPYEQSEIPVTSRHVRASPLEAGIDFVQPPTIQSLLPKDTVLSKPECLVFPDGAFMELPLEMLPRTTHSKKIWGAETALCLGLRSTPPAEAWRSIDLSGGWLGLGDIPAAGNLPYLEWTKNEIEGLRDFLKAQGHPAWTLLGERAQVGNLCSSLESLCPTVLHFATHGVANEDFPDACALVLADSPTLPQRELLPYRCVLSLPLQSVALVVLSACSTLIGQNTWSAGMRGLAWAFLEAGVPQVLASRYPVGDEATAELMKVFYGFLPGRPVAEALRLTRQHCLNHLKLSPREVGAWSVWC